MTAPQDAERSPEDEEALMKEWESMAGGGGGGGGEGEDGDDADAMAAEWEAMLGGDEGGGGGATQAKAEFTSSASSGRESTRVLNQDEIDSLLGFDDTDDERSDKTGIQAILNSALVSYERLPMLEVVFDRLVRMMSTSLRNFTSDNVEVSLDNIYNLRFGDYLNSIPLPAMLTVFKAEEWDNYGLMTVDSALIYSIVDVLLGGAVGQPLCVLRGGLIRQSNAIWLSG